MQDVPEEWREERGGDRRTRGPEGRQEKGDESLMMELTRLVQEAVRGSSWWERRGIDCSILAAAFLCLPPGETQVSLPAAGLLAGCVLCGGHAADGRGPRRHHLQRDASGQPRRAERVAGLGQLLGRLLHRGLRLLLGAGRRPRPHQDAPRSHQRGGPGRLQRVEGALPAALRLPVRGPPVRPRHHAARRARSPQRTPCGPGGPHRADGGAGPVLAVLAADPLVRLPVAAQRPALHAGVQSHVLRALHPRQHLPAHRPPHVRSDPPAQEDLPDDPRRPEPAAQRAAGLDVRTLAHQLPRGAPPLPLPVRQHVPESEAPGVQIPDGEAASIPGGRLPVPPHHVLPQVPGADGVCSAHHGAGGGAVTTGIGGWIAGLGSVSQRHLSRSRYKHYTVSTCSSAVCLIKLFYNVKI
ncbi:uncharacterized protein fads6 isoform X1 [Pungitius pungitius]|uniref:uncharacterized protein fads6 isoform X1 n=1 Tax=Pungitius pungitius TaxID=134920 RepID=UPI002E0D88F7